MFDLVQILPVRWDRMDPVLRADGLIKSVGSGRARRRLLDGVSLTVAPDEIVAVLGRSGSGKSCQGGNCIPLLIIHRDTLNVMFGHK
jgi:ABC-type glutathione transport system ATPase component